MKNKIAQFGIVLLLTAGTVGCVATLQGAYVPAQDMDVTWLGRDADRVRPGGLAQGDGVLDGHFQIKLDLAANETIESVGVFQTNASGASSFGYGTWHTSTNAGLNWVAAVFEDGKQLNTRHVPTLGQFGGATTLDVYVAENEWIGHLRNGNHIVVEVNHGGKSSKKLITLGQPTHKTRPSATAMRSVPAAPSAVQRSEKRFPDAPAVERFPQAPQAKYDIAVIVGNADYASNKGGIPDVTPAHADAEGFKRWVMQAKGVRDGNIIDLRDATSAQLVQVFGSHVNAQGKLYDWVYKDRSKVYVYYSGHGAPGKDGGAYLVPTDAEAARIDLVGYPLELLYKNLSELQAKSVTVVLEACFSGVSQAGALISKASPIYLKTKKVAVPEKLTVITAGHADQMASWDQDEKHSLFTKYFLKAMSGEADEKPYGNGDGAIAHDELRRYLDETLTYLARRYYGRDQNAEVIANGAR